MKIILPVLLSLFTLFLPVMPLESVDQMLSIIHIDVGQGDATLIISPSGQTMLIDAGINSAGYKKVVPYLKKMHISSLDYVVASHYDEDHIGGLDEVIDSNTTVLIQAYDHGAAGTTQTFKDYEKAIHSKRKTITTGANQFNMGPDVSIDCVAVNARAMDGATPTKGEPDENSKSIALHLRYGKFDYFVGGDLTGGGKSGSKTTLDVESLVAPLVKDVDVLRINHHGSLTSSKLTFLQKLNPEVVIISVGNGGRNLLYKHPNRKVLDRLQTLTSLKAIYQTNRGETLGGLTQKDLKLIHIENGSVVLQTDGTVYFINGTLYEAF